MLPTDQMKFAEYYNIDADAYDHKSIKTLSFSVRVINRFMRHKIMTVKDLLLTSPAMLMSIDGFGLNSLQEIESFIAGLVNGNSVVDDDVHKETEEPAPINHDDPTMSFVQSSKRYQVAYDTLGEDMAKTCFFSPEKARPIMAMLSEYSAQMQSYIQLTTLIWQIPPFRRNNKAGGYVKAFTMDEHTRKQILSVYKDSDAALIDIENTEALRDPIIFDKVYQFLQWCTFDLSREITAMFTDLYSSNRAEYVIKARAEGKTLEEIGKPIKVTRERIRQIEMSARKSFARRQNKLRIVSKISADLNGETVLHSYDIAEYSGDHTDELIYLLQGFDSKNYTYDKQFDVFIIGDDSLQSRVCAYIESLPDIIHVRDIPKILEQALDEENIPHDVLRVALADAYKTTGDVYHRVRLSLATMYAAILEQYYPTGIKAYDPIEIDRFRSLIRQNYGDVDLPTNDRALTARMASICVLCGKGVYRLKQERYMPKALAKRIYDYIINSNNTIFLTNTIFSVFETELREAGVDNKYYLQGILHELYADKLVFRRDYISKDATVTSVYSSVVDFIKGRKHPVAKNEIFKEFPGITDIVVNFAIDDSNILNYFGEYLHASKLVFQQGDREYLKSVIDSILADGQAHHSREFYDVIDSVKPEILTRNYAMFQFSAFSILEYLFNDAYQFVRPYIAPMGIEVDRPSERLHDQLYAKEEFDISEISSFIRDNRHQIQSILEYVNECNDKFLFSSIDHVISIEKAGITYSIAQNVEDMILAEISETVPICSLECLHLLPKISIPWTDWLIYSVLYKWSTQLEVATSSNQLKLSVPLVAPKGRMQIEPFKDLTRSESTVYGRIDDLDNIDALLEEIIDDDLWEDEE